ncbi:hypothetical protein I3843_08G073900 [Carya illinoinensis]|nr:hypothetical protein I3843_08G073900 [Carya illinoinensis]
MYKFYKLLSQLKIFPCSSTRQIYVSVCSAMPASSSIFSLTTDESSIATEKLFFIHFLHIDNTFIAQFSLSRNNDGDKKWDWTTLWTLALKIYENSCS